MDVPDTSVVPPSRSPAGGAGAVPLRPSPGGRPSDARVGQVVDARYRLESLLSSGSMGRVYRAQQLNLDRVVAVKLMDLDPTLIRSTDIAGYRQRFLNEAAALARLQHPNTVRIFDFGFTDGVPYIVMEYLRGRSLAEVIRRDAPLPLERAVAIADGICRSLEEAHTAGVVHRDLKPSNILVLEDVDGTDRVKVLDFGLVKLSDEADAPTQRGQLLGSPNYMAPEIIREEPGIDGRADLYALGIILYRMLAGSLPFPRGRPASVLIAHLQKPVPPLRTAAPSLDLPEVVDWTVQRCLEKDRTLRFDSAATLRTALHACLRAARRTGAWNLELRLVDGVLVGPEQLLDATLSTPSVAPQPIVFQARAPVRETPPVADGSSRRQSWLIAVLVLLLVGLAGSWGVREWRAGARKNLGGLRPESRRIDPGGFSLPTAARAAVAPMYVVVVYGASKHKTRVAPGESMVGGRERRSARCEVPLISSPAEPRAGGGVRQVPRQSACSAGTLCARAVRGRCSRAAHSPRRTGWSAAAGPWTWASRRGCWGCGATSSSP